MSCPSSRPTSAESIPQEKSKPKKISKHGSRIAAVQIMYQIDMTGEEPEKVLFNFINHYLETENILKDINEKFLRKLVSHFKEKIDFEVIISKHLTKSGTVSGLSSLTKSIVKVAILEMICEKTDIPVIINEYVNVSKYFLEQKTVSFVNAILDKISKCVKRENLCLTNK